MDRHTALRAKRSNPEKTWIATPLLAVHDDIFTGQWVLAEINRVLPEINRVLAEINRLTLALLSGINSHLAKPVNPGWS